MSRSHPEQWTIAEGPGDAERPAASVVEALAGFPTTQIADCGGPVSVVGPGVGPVAGGTELCGTALPVWTKPGDILFVLKVPDLVRPGDVVVIDGGGRPDAAVIGDIIGAQVQRAGGVGLVVDGAVRDLDGLDELGLPTFARGAHPATASAEGPGAINVVVTCGGVVVRPGDVVRADRSGLVVVPREHAERVVALTREVAEREQGWLDEVARGRSLTEAVGVDERIASLRAAVPDPAP